jgi:DNA-binding transcriptional regulator YhcF (GntR family)
MCAMEIRLDRSGGVPLGTQLAWRLRSEIASGRLRPGDRLPSLRELAVAAGVHVNTVRAVYGRLESEGAVRTEHGRGTFVATPARGEASTRRELRAEIEALEAELARRPPPPTGIEPPRRPSRAALLSASELTAVRDELLDRLRDLDAARAELLERLRRLELGEQPASSKASRHSTPSLAGARIKWVGA